MPLNDTAIMGEKLVRCLPADQFEKGVRALYKAQNAWAFGSDPRQSLIDQGKTLGLSEEVATACVDSQEFETAIMEVARERSLKHGIASTPTFVINDGDLILRGTGVYETYKSAVETRYEEVQRQREAERLAAEEAAKTEAPSVPVAETAPASAPQAPAGDAAETPSEPAKN
jgi:hypothetical protein